MLMEHRMERQRTYRGMHLPFVKIELPSVEDAPVEIKRFSAEQRKALEGQYFEIYDFTGIGTLMKEKRDRELKCLSLWDRWILDPDFDALPSIRSEVAIKPSSLFLPDSDKEALKGQITMVKEFAVELRKEVPGVKAIIGQDSDYRFLAFAYFFAEERYLFRPEDYYNGVRTKTPTGYSVVAPKDNFGALYGQFVNQWTRYEGCGRVQVAPIVVPASPKLQK